MFSRRHPRCVLQRGVLIHTALYCHIFAVRPPLRKVGCGGSRYRVCNERINSYFSHTYLSLQSLVPTPSPLLVRFLRVYLQADPSRLLVATAACKHQSRLRQSSSKRSYNITDLRMKPPTMPHGNDRCTQARFAVTHARVRSSSGSFFPRLVLCVSGLRP